jgi:hypothetical protein
LVKPRAIYENRWEAISKGTPTPKLEKSPFKIYYTKKRKKDTIYQKERVA